MARTSHFPHPIAILLHNRTRDLDLFLTSLREQVLPLDQRRLWFFLDAYPGSKSEFQGDPNNTKHVLDIAYENYPNAKFYLNASNQGIANQFDTAERHLFDTYGDSDWVTFFEDDLILAPDYLRSLAELMTYAEGFDEICQVSVSGDTIGAQSEGPGALYLADHAWGFSLKRSHFKERQELVSQYLKMLEGRPYFRREHQRVIDQLLALGVLASGSSQDHVKRAIMKKFGRFFLTIGGHGGKYIGATGDNFTQEIFESLGYHGDEDAKAIDLDLSKIQAPNFEKLEEEFKDQLKAELHNFDELHESASKTKWSHALATLPPAMARRSSRLLRRNARRLKNRSISEKLDGRTLTEKIQYKMKHDRRPILTNFADKVAVRDYVAEKVGEKYLIERYQTGARWEEMDFSSLPEEFVFKPSHASRGGVLVYKSAIPMPKVSKEYMSLPWNGYLSLRPEDLDLELLKTKARLWMNAQYGNVKVNYEWAYQNIPPRLLLDKYIPGFEGNPPTNFNFFMFKGECKFINIVNHFSGFRAKVTPEWEYLPVVDVKYELLGPSGIPKKPDNLSELLSIATRLSDGIDFVRIDLYNERGLPLFSEMTNYPQAGVYPTNPLLYGRLFGHYFQQFDGY